MRRVWMAASFILVVLPASAMAQRGAGMAGGMRAGGIAGGMTAAVPRASASGPHVMSGAPSAARPGATGVRRARAGGGTVNRRVVGASGLSGLPLFSADANVPGLGFDYPHLAAVNSGRGRRRSGFKSGESFGFGGYLLSPEIVVENPQAVEDAQAGEEGSAVNAVDSVDGRYSQREVLTKVNSTPEPARDEAEYVFVRRDGGLLFAVAYSWENGTLRYVTREGVRKSVTQDTLDMDATQQFNEQRGLNFRVPA